MQLARAVRNRTTGVLYVLDEPSIGLHPSNIAGLTGVMHDLVADGNSVVLVDHDTQILSEADWIIEMGPEAGADGGRVIAQGTVAELAENPRLPHRPVSRRTGEAQVRGRAARRRNCSAQGTHSSVYRADPYGEAAGGGHSQGAADGGDRRVRLRQDHADAGKPGPGAGRRHSRRKAAGTRAGSGGARAFEQVKLIDATPIGINVRSTVATYANVHDELRKIFARTPDAKALGYKAGDFSYNTGKLRCPVCDGTGDHQPGRAVPAGCGYSLPGMPGYPLRQGGGQRALSGKDGDGIFPAGTDGHGRAHGAGGLRRI